MSEIQVIAAVSGNPDVDLDVEQRIEASDDLAARLAELPDVFVRRRALENRPDGTRAIDASAVGAVVAVLAGHGLLASMVGVVRAWLEHRTMQVTMKLGDDEITLRGGSDRSQERLGDAFLERHSELEQKPSD
jgi:Effector Associated Constant Component 1